MFMIFVIGKGFLETIDDGKISYTLYPTTHENVLKFYDDYEVNSWIIDNNFQEKYLIVQETETEGSRW